MFLCKIEISVASGNAAGRAVIKKNGAQILTSEVVYNVERRQRLYLANMTSV